MEASLASNVPRRIHKFIWVVFKDCLLTNKEWCRRGFADDPSLKLCQSVEEICLHVLQDCSQAKEVWKQLIPKRISNQFFSSLLEGWAKSIKQGQAPIRGIG